MLYNCLIIDDEIELANTTCEYFQMSDISCKAVYDISRAKEFFLNNSAEILLLDINLKDESGFSFCKEFRKNNNVPIIFISARQSDDDVLMALNIGGDDFIRKPYSLSILLAKVKVMLKRIHDSNREPLTKDEDAFLHPETMSVTVRGNEVILKAKEYALLDCLYQRKNTIVTKEELFDLVWKDMFFSDGTLNVHIRRLREKIEEDPNNPQMIKTIWGTGYMLEIKE